MIAESCRGRAKDTYLFEIIDRFVPSASVLTMDLQSARSFNITPSKARGTEDIGTLPVIGPDGSGLAATLYTLQTAPEREDGLFYRYRRIYQYYDEPERILSKILEYSKVVNPNIVAIDVSSDPIEAKLRIFVKMNYDGGILRLPFSLVSDGTAKWFTLVTAIATNENLFAIEEPENFLHPLMQIEIVQILRDQYESIKGDRFALITTHSETIINQCKPSEIIIFELKDGQTQARRPENVAEFNF